MSGANNIRQARGHKRRGPAVPVEHLAVAAMVPPSDPKVDGLRVTDHNPPVDIAATIEFNQHRFQGMPLRGANGQARKASGSTGRTPQNRVVVGVGGGQTGTYISNQYGAATAYAGMYAGHSGWTMAEFGYGQQNQLLYGPTARPPYSCIEVGTAYRPGTATPPQVYAYDFCDRNAVTDPVLGKKVGSFVPLFNVDAAFRSTFERDFGDGVPQYTIEILPNPDGRSTAYLYNWVAGLFLPYYTSQSSGFNDGFAQPDQGWDLFEPKYTNGTCVSAPQIEANAIQGYNTVTGQWTSWTGVPTAGEGPAVAGSCIGYDDGSGIGSYYVYYPNSVASWNVYSEDSYVAPPPGGCDAAGGCCDPLTCCDPTIECCYGFEVGCCGAFDPSCCDYSFSSCCDGFTGTPCALAKPRSASSSSGPRRMRASPMSSTRVGPIGYAIQSRDVAWRGTGRFRQWSS